VYNNRIIYKTNVVHGLKEIIIGIISLCKQWWIGDECVNVRDSVGDTWLLWE
jgi:hypothetical protein